MKQKQTPPIPARTYLLKRETSELTKETADVNLKATRAAIAAAKAAEKPVDEKWTPIMRDGVKIGASLESGPVGSTARVGAEFSVKNVLTDMLFSLDAYSAAKSGSEEETSQTVRKDYMESDGFAKKVDGFLSAASNGNATVKDAVAKDKDSKQPSIFTAFLDMAFKQLIDNKLVHGFASKILEKWIELVPDSKFRENAVKGQGLETKLYLAEQRHERKGDVKASHAEMVKSKVITPESLAAHKNAVVREI